MKLPKSKKNAFLLGLVISVIMVAVVFTAEGLLSGFSGFTEHALVDNLISSGVPGILLLLAVACVTALVQAGISAVVIYHLDDTHYGPGGAVRWILFALWMAVAFVVIRRFLPDTGSAGMDLAREGVGVARILFSYWFAFRLIPRRSDAGGAGNPPAEYSAPRIAPNPVRGIHLLPAPFGS